MSVIVSRAIPEIDGFKPSHRKLLYTMYKMGLLTGGRTKSANIVGQTMRLNPHGDAAIYETMVRLAKGNESLLHPFVDSKASLHGDYLPGKLGMDDGESVIYLLLPGDYSGQLLFFFENGKAARVELKAYATVSNRRRLTGAYSDKSPLVTILPLREDQELALLSSEPRALIFHTSQLAPKATRTTQGVAVMTLKPKYHLQRAVPVEQSGIVNLTRYRTRSIPAAGALVKPEDQGEEQLSLL